jgi:hypothetical protein
LLFTLIEALPLASSGLTHSDLAAGSIWDSAIRGNQGEPANLTFYVPLAP